MKLAISTLVLALLACLALAVEQPKEQVIISYPKNTPNSVLEEAKKAIVQAGGMITHEYHLIKAFSANAPAKVLDSIKAMDAKDDVVIEKDETVSINKPPSQ